MSKEPTTLKAAGGYSCHNNTARRTTSYEYRRSEVGGIPADIARVDEAKTRWNDVACGHITSGNDVGCEGCRYRNAPA